MAFQIVFVLIYNTSIQYNIGLLLTIGALDLVGLRLLGGFGTKNLSSQRSTLRILIYNWRDTKHIYGGGAEVYIQEMAERWVKDGHEVTIFCGNDSHSQ